MGKHVLAVNILLSFQISEVDQTLYIWKMNRIIEIRTTRPGVPQESDREPVTRPRFRGARMDVERPFRPPKRCIIGRRPASPLVTAGIRGALFKHDVLTTRTSHFLAEFRRGLPTQGADQRNK